MILAVVLGIAFMVAGLRMYLSQTRLRRRCTIETQGMVVALKRVKRRTIRSGYNRDKLPDQATYAPVFEYVVDGRKIKKQAEISSHIRFEVGGAITVYYNPDNAWESYVMEDRTERFAGLFFATAGLVFVVLGGIAVFL